MGGRFLHQTSNNKPQITILCLLGLVCIPHSASAARIYITNERGGNVSVIDPAENEVVATIPVGKRPRGIHATADGKTVFVALSGTPISPPGKERLDLPADKKADGIGVIDAVS